jgi:hypothetical protein
MMAAYPQVFDNQASEEAREDARESDRAVLLVS